MLGGKQTSRWQQDQWPLKEEQSAWMAQEYLPECLSTSLQHWVCSALHGKPLTLLQALRRAHTAVYASSAIVGSDLQCHIIWDRQLLCQYVSAVAIAGIASRPSLSKLLSYSQVFQLKCEELTPQLLWRGALQCTPKGVQWQSSRCCWWWVQPWWRSAASSWVLHSI